MWRHQAGGFEGIRVRVFVACEVDTADDEDVIPIKYKIVTRFNNYGNASTSSTVYHE
jgi:hypothetical protein